MISASLRKTAASFLVFASLAFVGAGSAPVLGATITVSDPNCSQFAVSGDPSALTLTCVGSTTTSPGAPTGCVATINGQTTSVTLPSSGGTVTLGVQGCTAGSYSWTRNGVASSTTDTLPANSGSSAVTTTYAVNACNGSACASSTVTAIVSGTGTTGGPPIGGVSCAAYGFGKTMFYNWNWANPSQFVQTYDDSQGPIGTNGIVVIAFTPTSGSGSVSVSEYPGGLGNGRSVSISTQPCDFSQPSPWTRFGYNASIQFTVAPSINRSLPTLQPGTQYYLNIANRDAYGLSTCVVFCDVRINASKSN
jgi:hypothetical protein